DPERDRHFMGLALDEARAALATGDVPVGAVLVGADGVILGQGRNRREAVKDPTAHAELEALRAAAAHAGAWQLPGSSLYVTLEPCLMCAGALVLGRIGRLIYGAEDPKAGAIGSLFRLAEDVRLNHRYPVTAGVCAEE